MYPKKQNAAYTLGRMDSFGNGSIELGYRMNESYLPAKDQHFAQTKVFSARADFDVLGGRTYELRLLLQYKGSVCNAPERNACELTLTFLDDEGFSLDGLLEGGAPVVPELNPATVEVAPAGLLTDAGIAAAEATRILLAPPDARRLIIHNLPNDVELIRSDVQPVSINWNNNQGKETIASLKRISDLKLLLIKRMFGISLNQEIELKHLLGIPVRQAEALSAYFSCKGSWSPIVEQLADGDTLIDEYELRTSRLRAQASNYPRVGFIGSPRGRERLQCMAEVVWLRETIWKDQISILDIELIVIEAVAASGTGAETNWQAAFSNLDGNLSAQGAEFFDVAAENNLAVHLWFTSGPDTVDLWRAAANRATKVIAEGAEENWTALPSSNVVRPATEPTACSMAYMSERPSNLMLVPVVADLFQFPEFNAFVDEPSLYDTLLSEFTYDFNPAALSNRLKTCVPTIFAGPDRSQQRALMQAARIVLLSSRSLRSDEALAQIAVDSIASGALPVMFGRYEGTDTILAQLDAVISPTDLKHLQALWRITWLRERRWRTLFRQVMHDRVWQSEDRTAILGRDPFPNGFDKLRVSAIMVTKRPHLLSHCLKTFRDQSWPNKELIIIVNTGEIPNDLPNLRDNEHIYALPTAATVGECLNRGIATATGRYWTKMDDDDFYSSNYLEETSNYYRSTQADVVGRQAVGYYFAGEGVTKWREAHTKWCHTMFDSRGVISGATLSGDVSVDLPPFSVTERNSVDSRWVARVVRSGYRVYGGDATSMIVYRDSDENKHTWKMSATRGMLQQLATIATGSLFERIEK